MAGLFRNRRTRNGSGVPLPPARQSQRLRCVTMAEIALRVRLIGGDHVDVTYSDGDAAADKLVQHVISTLAEDGGALRCNHGDRLIVLYGRGVATVEVAPRGAIV